MTSMTLFCVFIVTFELISHLFIVFLLLALNMLNVNRAKISMRKIVYFGPQSWTEYLETFTQPTFMGSNYYNQKLNPQDV